MRAADATLRPFIGHPQHHFIVLWDHSGSGRDSEPTEMVEVFEELGERISIPMFKSGRVVERISDALRRWFPPS